jgi:glucose-1-phosphate thymidylyltransferase
MWGIVPAAGMGTRIQPLAFSKELLPVGSRVENGAERPRAVSEYVVERMVKAGATRICMVISPGKADIVNYFGGSLGGAEICYVVQERAGGLCDAVFRALPLVAPDEHAVVGLPDTVWVPDDALDRLPDDPLSFLLFPVDRPELFDAVLTGRDDEVEEIRVKHPKPSTRWVWGAFKLTGAVLRELHALWLERDRKDPYIGTLVNAWLRRGNRARGVRAGTDYVDVGTLNGYREAQKLLLERGDGGS